MYLEPVLSTSCCTLDMSKVHRVYYVRGTTPCQCVKELIAENLRLEI